MSRKSKLVLVVLAICLYLVFFLLSQWPDRYVHVVFCDVGQGDAILINYQFWQALVDGGPDSQVLACLSDQMPFWDRRIELVVATHPDTDHINGLTQVLSRYQVQQVLVEPIGKNTLNFNSIECILFWNTS